MTLEQATGEYQKGIKQRENLLQQLNTLTTQLTRLEGAIMILKEQESALSEDTVTEVEVGKKGAKKNGKK